MEPGQADDWGEWKEAGAVKHIHAEEPVDHSSNTSVDNQLGNSRFGQIGIWVKSGPENLATFYILKIWVKYGSENNSHSESCNLPAMLMLGQYVWIRFGINLSFHGIHKPSFSSS